jgi:hypothetical protein
MKIFMHESCFLIFPSSFNNPFRVQFSLRGDPKDRLWLWFRIWEWLLRSIKDGQHGEMHENRRTTTHSCYFNWIDIEKVKWDEFQASDWIMLHYIQKSLKWRPFFRTCGIAPENWRGIWRECPIAFRRGKPDNKLIFICRDAIKTVINSLSH